MFFAKGENSSHPARRKPRITDMEILMRKVLGVVVALTATGCMSAGTPPPRFAAPLVQVERSPVARERGGEAAPVAPTTPNAYRFEDNLIAADVGLLSGSISLKIRNKSSSTMRLLWDDATFIEPDGGASRVMHTGVRFLESDRFQPPSVIPAGATLTDEATPVNRVSFVAGHWRTAPLIATGQGETGTRMGLLVPLEIDGQKAEYTFRFELREGAQRSQSEPATAKPFYRRTWFIVAAVLVGLSVIGNSLPDTETSSR